MANGGPLSYTFLLVLILFERREFLIATCRIFFFQAEDGIRDVERSRGLGDVYKRQEAKGEGENISRSTKYSPLRIQEACKTV